MLPSRTPSNAHLPACPENKQAPCLVGGGLGMSDDPRLATQQRELLDTSAENHPVLEKEATISGGACAIENVFTSIALRIQQGVQRHESLLRVNRRHWASSSPMSASEQ